MQSHAVAAKAVIQHPQSGYLVMRRRNTDAHQAGTWDLPGGRIDPGENPHEALIRECKEEAGLGIRIIKPIGVHSFTRDDGQIIVMIIFYCTSDSDNVVLSEEHDEYEWTTRELARDRLQHMGYAFTNI